MSHTQHALTSSGKKRRLARLSDANGRFSMLAIDQRQSLRKMIAGKTGEAPESVAVSALKQVKRVVTANLSGKASAVLTDPFFGYASTLDIIPGSTGILLSMEQTGYATVNNRERLTRLLPDWNVDMALRAGADGIKLLVWYNKDTSEATLEHQTNLVRSIGKACDDHSIPFVLEVVGYPLDDTSVSSPDYAQQKADGVIHAAQTFSAPEYGVDLLKLEFPGNLQFVKEYQDSHFHAGSVVHDITEIKDFCRQVDDVAAVPWVILSAGVEPEEFIENIKLSNDTGASGFLCGRAVWKDVIQSFPDNTAMQTYITETASQNFHEILAANRNALPWFQHKYHTESPATRSEIIH